MGVWKDKSIMEEYEQEQQQQFQGPASMPYFGATVLPSDKADLYDKINPQDIVEILKWKLMGYEFDRNQGQWYKPTWKKGLSEMGATEITTLMTPVSSKNIIISKLSDSEVRDRTKMLVNTAIKLCIQNWKSYGITGPDQIFLIKEIVLSNTFITLKQPENAGAREFLGKTSSENKSIIDQPSQQGRISRLFRG